GGAPALRAGGRSAAHAAGNRRPSAPLARARPPDRDARERQAAPLGQTAIPFELTECRHEDTKTRRQSSTARSLWFRVFVVPGYAPGLRSMPCPLCDGTGWKPIDEHGVRRVVRCDCWRAQVGVSRLADANVPKRYQHCTLTNF